MRIAIIGAGLAGTACAYKIKQEGMEPVIYEAGGALAPGASGNPLGLYNPRLAGQPTPESEFYAEAFRHAITVFPALIGVDWKPCGSLHLATDEKKAKRFSECAKNWARDELRMVNAREASEIAGVEIAQDGLWMPGAGVVSPAKLCAAYAKGVEIHFNAKIEDLSTLKADYIVLANGMGAVQFEETKHLPLKAVRGQVTFVAANEKSKNVKCNLCYGGYLAPATDGQHMVGSTFQRWLDHSEIIEADDADNIAKLAAAVPSLAGEYEVTGRRAAVRATRDNHFPLLGPVSPKIYISAAHASHGIITSIMAAKMIADDIVRRS